MHRAPVRAAGLLVVAAAVVVAVLAASPTNAGPSPTTTPSTVTRTGGDVPSLEEVRAARAYRTALYAAAVDVRDRTALFAAVVHDNEVAGANHAAALAAAARRAREVTRRSSGSSSGRGQRPPVTYNAGGVWQALAQCESGGNWSINTGNGYEGGLQFLNSTWLAMGGGAYAQHAYDATPAQQIAVAQRLQAQAGWGQWPACARKLGLL